jgi:hypothetical protein
MNVGESDQPVRGRGLDDGTCHEELFLSEPYRQRVSVHCLEDLTTTVEQAIPNDAPRMKEHFRLFRQKYLLPDPSAAI